MNQEEYDFSGESPMKACYEAILRWYTFLIAAELYTVKKGHVPKCLAKWMNINPSE